jgi:protein phosphatase
MGTTAVVALCVDNEAIIGNVGDSRGYRICDEITQVTVDHSLVQQLVDAGEISEEEAKDHPQRNVVSQSLGNRVDIEPDIFRITVDGTILLCSDGLTEEVSDERIKEIVNDAPTVEEAADVLIQTANKNGGHDNISVALYSC